MKLAGSIEIRKDSSGDWEVLKNGRTVGWLYKEHHSGTGRASFKWTGYVAPYDTWEFQPEDLDADVGSWNSFKKAKSGLPDFIEQHGL